MSGEQAMIRRTGAIAAIVLLAAAFPAAAQETTGGHVATSAAGIAGQRQIKEQGVTGIKPLARIDNRIRNRVQSRIRNRIDRNYDPQANAVSPFKVAGDQARTAGKPRGQ